MIIDRWTNTARDEQRLGDILAVAAFIVYMVGDFLFRYATMKTNFPIIAELNLVKVAEALSMALAIAAIATRKRTLSGEQITLLVITLALLLFSYAFTGDNALVRTCIIIIAIGGMSLKKLCGIYGIALLAMITAVIALSVFGLINNVDIVPNSRLVFSYGLGHPNGTGSFLFACCAALAYFYWNKQAWWVPLVISVVSAVFSYALLSSHAAAVVLSVLAIAIVVGHAMERKGTALVPGKVFFAVLTVLPFLMLLSMIVSTAFYSAENPIFSLLNKILHERPHFAHEYYTGHDGFTLFGSKYAGGSNYHNGLPFTSVDSGYSRLALSTGVFAFIAMSLVYVVAIRNLSQENPHFLIMVIVLLCAAHLVIENHQLYLSSGIMTLFVSYAFAGKKSAPG